MIPQFPKFKNIELSDKEEVEKITKQYPPYSDFNFVSMWSWDTEEKIMLSILNDNLVVRFTDYVTNEPFYSFLGSNKVNNTIEKLLELSRKEGLSPELRLIPEDSIKGINNEIYIFREDKDNFDYILSTKILKDFDSKDSLIKRKKRAVNSLIKEHSPYVEMLDLNNKDSKEAILYFIEKIIPNNNKINNKEILAIQRFIEGYRDVNFIILGSFVKDKLVGFSFIEILQKEFAIFHFWKADIRMYKSMYSYLLKESSRLISDGHNREFLNIEQDLGLENLRKWKSSFSSDIFLKKYIVSKK